MAEEWTQKLYIRVIIVRNLVVLNEPAVFLGYGGTKSYFQIHGNKFYYVTMYLLAE